MRRCCAGTGAEAGSRGSPAPRSAGPRRSTPGGRGARSTASAVNVMSRFTNSAACVLGHRRGLGRGVAELLEEAVRAGSRDGQVAATGSRSRSSGHERADRRVEVRSAAGQAAAVAVERVARADPCLVVEHVEEVVELDDRAGAPARSGSSHPASRSSSPRPGRELDVLEAERRTRPHEQRGVGRQRLDLLVELHRDLGVGGAVLAPLRLDLRDLADARAADAHLEPLHELGGVRQVGLEVVGGHEGQARHSRCRRGRRRRS